MRRTLAIFISATLLFAACGGDTGPDPADDPKGALVSGFRALGESGLTLTLRLNTTAEDLAAMAQDSGDNLTTDDAQKIIESSLSVTTNGDSDPENQQVEIVANVAGIENAVELKMVDQVLYARGDIRALAEEFGADTAELDMAAQQAPPGFEFIGPALEGEWISLQGFEQLAQQFSGQAPSEATEEDAAKAQQFADDIAAVLETSATVTHEGSDDIGEHLIATVNVREFYGGLVDALGSFGGLASSQLGQLPPESEVPDEDIRLDVWIDGGRAVQVELDFLQFAAMSDEEVPAGVDQLALLVELEKFDGDVEVPEDSVTVDLNALMQGFLGGFGGMDSGSGGEATIELPDDFCDQLVGQPEEVVTQFAEECPDLQP